MLVFPGIGQVVFTGEVWMTEDGRAYGTFREPRQSMQYNLNLADLDLI